MKQGDTAPATTIATGKIPPGPAEPYRAPQDLLVWMRENFERYGDIYKASIYGSDAYVINAPEYAEHVLLRNWENFPRAGAVIKRIALSLGNGLMSSTGPLWVRQRRMMQAAFTREAVGALFETFVKLTLGLCEKWKQAARGGSSVNVTEDISTTVLDVMLLVIFGDDYARVAPHFQVVGAESRNLEFAQACSALKKVTLQIASERREQARDANDMLGRMLRARDRDSGPMTDAQLGNEALTLVIAGHETTASVLNWIWYLLARHPDVEDRLVSELRDSLGEGDARFEDLPRFAYTRQVIEEALRIYPPGWLLAPRRAVKPDRMGEYQVPAGTEIYISPYLLQRHPRLWREPDRFDPARFAAESEHQPRLSMCPFSVGPRNCIGEFFARVEMQVHVMLVARELRLKYEDPNPASFVAGVNLLSKDPFIMRPELRRTVGAVNRQSHTASGTSRDTRR